MRLDGSGTLVLRQDAATRAAYSGDASIYRRWPRAVAEPRTVEELRQAVRLARARGWSLVPRGGGTSVAGNAIGGGLVLDHSRHQRGILGIDAEARAARVEPGVVCDDLRVAALRHGLTYGPDPSTHSRCTIGGMVANNACGSHSLAWGTAADNLLSARLLLGDGREVDVGRGRCSDPGIEAQLRALAADGADVIRAELGRFPRQVSGYGLHHLLPERGFDVAKALAGSEGTCGIFTELTVALVTPPAATALVVLGYADVFEAARAAPGLRLPGVQTIEGMGADLIAALRTRAGRQDAGSTLPTGGAWLFCEVAGEDAATARAAGEALAAGSTGAAQARVITDPEQARILWEIREAAAGIATRRADGGEAWPGWEDSAVPAERLEDYLYELYALMRRHGLAGIPFGHFGEGCVHVRIDFDLATVEGVAGYREFITAAAELVHRHGGSLSGEHGDGRARSAVLDRMYSPRLRELFARFKAIFDPDGLFNPGVLVDAEAPDDRIRPGPGLRTHNRPAVHALATDGGDLGSAINRCVGVGACRAPDGGMCPSYQATRDEVHTTRGRARVLAEMLRGEHLVDGWRSTAVRDALDLCLSCRSCATECPVNVDMATYKAEFLHRHYAGRLHPRAHYTMGWLPVLAAGISGAGLGPALDAAMTIRPLERAAMRAAGLEPRRRMIGFGALSLTAWLTERARRGQAPPAAPDAPVLLLWPDTFTNRLAPHVGIAAVEVLEALGYAVVVPEGLVCCGLTWHSTGQLRVGRRVLRRTLDVLAPHVDAGRRVVGLEPSCTVQLAEAPELLPHDPRAAALSEAVTPFADVVAARLEEAFSPSGSAGSGARLGRLEADAVVQVHCHEKAKGNPEARRRVLGRLGVRVAEVPGGCCGLAGNFGFEPGHDEVSTACAERALFPMIRDRPPGSLVLADGFSCRTQVAQGTGVTARHLAEVIRLTLSRS